MSLFLTVLFVLADNLGEIGSDRSQGECFRWLVGNLRILLTVSRFQGKRLERGLISDCSSK